LKKFIFSFFIFFGLSVLLSAQEVTFSVLSSDEKGISIRVDFPDMTLHEVNVEGTVMYKIMMKEAFPVEKFGAPEILKSTKSIVIPDGATPVLKVVDVYSEMIDNFALAPSKGIFYRNQNPDSIPYMKGEEYQIDAFYPSTTAVLNHRYTLRDFEAISISCYPYRYNPVTKTLQKNHYMILRIDFENACQQKKKKLLKEFTPVFHRHFLNFTPTDQVSTLPQEEGDMLIISPEAYISALEPFKKWKIRNGIHTEIVTIESVGNTSGAIKNYITDYYQNSGHNLVFVLLVGDRYDISPYYSSGYIYDNWYTEVAGDDEYPDLFLGRMLASSLEDVTVQVEKSIIYESNPPETAHFPLFCGIASNEGPGDQDEWDYQHIQNINHKLRNFTYTSGYELLHFPEDGSSAPTSAMLSGALHNGVGIVNYAGHGNWDRFVTTSFYNYHVETLTNYNKLPFILSVACQNGNYSRNQACFAQKWLTATKNGQPVGAVATVMSTKDQPWNPPMAGQDEMIDILTEAHSQGMRRTFGAICFNAFLKMMDVYTSDYPYYSRDAYRSWLIFGDPSLMVRTAVPDNIAVTHPEKVFYGNTSMTVQSAVEDAKLVLTYQNTILWKGYMENGIATVSYTCDIPVGDTIHILASKFNHIPYQGTIIVTDSNASQMISEYENIKINIYPNPAVHQVAVDFNHHTFEQGMIYLYDIYGRLMMTHPVRNRIENISVETFSSGFYILRVMNGNKTVKNFKLIKNE
jgi:gingipain R